MTETDSRSASDTPISGIRALLVLAAVIVAGAAVLYGMGVRLPHHSSDDSAAIGSKIGGTCAKTTYYIQSKIDGSKQTIYDCTVDSKEMCVTYSGGIATDSTDEVKLLFQNTLGTEEPSCAI
jgi:hypothetical protein